MESGYWNDVDTELKFHNLLDRDRITILRMVFTQEI